MAANRNRTAGIKWEQQVVRELKELGFKDAVSSRYASKMTDDAGIDIMGTEDIAIQCKNTAQGIDYHKIITSMNTDKHKVILHKRTKKKGDKFYKVGEYAIITKELLYKLLEERK